MEILYLYIDIVEKDIFSSSSDVGFKVGRNSGISYLVMQIHYGDVSAFRGKSWYQLKRFILFHRHYAFELPDQMHECIKTVVM